MSLYDIAFNYLNLGYHPIPCMPGTKKPLIKWKEFQDSPPTIQKLKEWFNGNEDRNIALVLGRGTMAVDLDGHKEAERLLYERGIILPENAPRNITSKGYHVLLKVKEFIPDSVGLLSNMDKRVQVDIRGVGYIMVPPSTHPDGTKYRWAVDLKNVKNLPLAPSELITLIKSQKINHENKTDNVIYGRNWIVDSLIGVNKGERNNICSKLAGYFFAKGLSRDIVKTILVNLYGNKCNPPLEKNEIEIIVDSISNKASLNGQVIREIQPRTIGDVADEFYENLKTKDTYRVSTGIKSLDDLFGDGFSTGELIYMGARPSIGKTALALQIGTNLAKKMKSVLFVSREMVASSLIKRILANQSGVEMYKLRHSKISSHELERVKRCISKIGTIPFYMSDDIVTMSDLIETLTHFHPDPPLSLMIVDYLQILNSGKKHRDKRADVEAVSGLLKNVAMQYKIPVLCLSSLSRGNNDPSMASLRESGELEHDADIVILLDRKVGAQTISCRVVKNRDGRIGTKELIFKSEFMQFEDVKEIINSEEFIV